jgi:hypothetical protein
MRELVCLVNTIGKSHFRGLGQRSQFSKSSESMSIESYCRRKSLGNVSHLSEIRCWAKCVLLVPWIADAVSLSDRRYRRRWCFPRSPDLRVLWVYFVVLWFVLLHLRSGWSDRGWKPYGLDVASMWGWDYDLQPRPLLVTNPSNSDPGTWRVLVLLVLWRPRPYLFGIPPLPSPPLPLHIRKYI